MWRAQTEWQRLKEREARKLFRRGWRPFNVTNGFGGYFARLLMALQPLPRTACTLKTVPYVPSPIFSSFSYFCISLKKFDQAVKNLPPISQGWDVCKYVSANAWGNKGTYPWSRQHPDFWCWKAWLQGHDALLSKYRVTHNIL